MSQLGSVSARRDSANRLRSDSQRDHTTVLHLQIRRSTVRLRFCGLKDKLFEAETASYPARRRRLSSRFVEVEEQFVQNHASPALRDKAVATTSPRSARNGIPLVRSAMIGRV